MNIREARAADYWKTEHPGVVEPVAPATPKQRAYLASLLDQIVTEEARAFSGSASLPVVDWDNLTKAKASNLIETAKAELDNMKRRNRASRPAPVQLEDGMYRMNGETYKVQHAVHGSGRQYAKWLDTQVMRFVYAPGVIQQLQPTDRMSLEQAKEFGAIYGVCCVCAATLTNEESIAAGIGPVCSGRI